jgi:hypothetical protein
VGPADLSPGRPDGPLTPDPWCLHSPGVVLDLPENLPVPGPGRTWPSPIPQIAKLGIQTGLFRRRGCVLECCPLDHCPPKWAESVIVWPLPRHRRWVPAFRPFKLIRTVSRSARTSTKRPMAFGFTE